MAESVRRLQAALRPERNREDAIRVFPGVGHTLADPDSGWVSREVLACLNDWVLQAVGGLDLTMHGR